MAPQEVAPAALPEPLRRLVSDMVGVQRELNAQLRAQLQLAKRGDSMLPALSIMVISFLYGVFHAIGPGHGKLVVGSYFLTRRARIAHGLAMSGSAAFVQALAAIVLVGVLAVVFELGPLRINEQAANLEMISYAGITALGLWMGWGALSGRACCEHADEPGHDHGHGHVHGPACGHGHHRQSAMVAQARAARGELARVLATGAAVGLRPCSGAILVLLFTLANGIFLVGVLSTFAMGLGVAITVSVVSLTTLGLHRGLSALGDGHQRLALRLRQAAALAGALFITLFGLVQLYGLWSGGILPLAG